MIPALLLDGDALVKTMRFGNAQYVGDPTNVLSIFSALEVDEIVLLGIRVRSTGNPPPFGLLTRLANECLIPLSYGGGLTTLDDVHRLIELGYEKAIINSALIAAPSVVSEAAKVFGSQAIVASIDAVERSPGRHEAVTEGGSRFLGSDPATLARRAQELGAGEILLTSVDRDGTMSGYDLPLIDSVSSAVSIPVIACGGANSRPSLAEPVRGAGASAVAAGSLFVYQGQNRSVLINFPTRSERATIFSQRD